jgi:hypothetical protein
MNQEFPGLFPFVRPQVEKPVIVQPPAQLVEQPSPPAEPAQVNAVDTVFAQEPENPSPAVLLGLWSSGMLLADLARDHLNPPAAADEPAQAAETDDVQDEN